MVHFEEAEGGWEAQPAAGKATTKLSSLAIMLGHLSVVFYLYYLGSNLSYAFLEKERLLI
jgi:hypothetical protein